MRRKVILACSVCGSRNYSTNKKRTAEGRMEMNKFCKRCKTHTVHRETK